MSMTAFAPNFEVLRDMDRCILCGKCTRECSYGVHQFSADHKRLHADEAKCVNCFRCVAACPKQAIYIEEVNL